MVTIQQEMARSMADPLDHALKLAETDVRDARSATVRQCGRRGDGSTDEIAQILAGLDVTVLRNKENCGKAGSLSRVFEHALAHRAIGVITLDADGQHEPEEIPSFVKQSLNDPNAFLVGARRRDHEEPRSGVCGESDRRFLDRLGCVAADPG